MVKIRTVEDLDRAIDGEVVWRKRELTTALQLAQRSSGTDQRVNLRSGVVILYAHWEGWIKTVAQLYVRYVNTLSIPYEALSEAFLGNALKTKMSAIEEATAPLVHNQFASFMRTGLSKGARLSEDLVRTESNLSSNVLFDILERIGLENRPAYSLRANRIDTDLVQKRNTIAHGQHLDLTLDDFRSLRTDILELLEIFTDDVRNAASMGKHLATPTPQV